ncbi:MAG TPA: twin-arginine translocation signal domain-containing protein [Terriglobia bacterium]|nr:twin-arginine translocation signal domain-containing protein [Terriglobia bacterium]
MEPLTQRGENIPRYFHTDENPHRPREISRAISWSRREFLRAATGSTAAGAMMGFAPLRGVAQKRGRKAVVVTFGGGARDEETFMPDGQENIPHLLAELIPRATFFTQVVNRGILGHYVATASLATGVYERFNNFAAVPPENPTVFEYFRKDLKRPSTDAWVVAPSNGFNRIGESGDRAYGPGLGAGVILPKRLLAAALSSGHGLDYSHLLTDNYETPYYTPNLSGSEIELTQLATILKLSVDDFATHARSLASPDELSVYVARQLMRQLAPSLLWITLHDMDIAHAGSYSLYVDGIQRSDRLCAEIWKMIQSEPEYAGKTTLFILPDFGRDSDGDSGGNGFQHHRTGDPLSRTTWMMVMGPGIRENVVIERPVESTDLVPTLGSLLGFSARMAQGKPLAEVL